MSIQFLSVIGRKVDIYYIIMCLVILKRYKPIAAPQKLEPGKEEQRRIHFAQPISATHVMTDESSLCSTIVSSANFMLTPQAQQYGCCHPLL